MMERRKACFGAYVLKLADLLREYRDDLIVAGIALLVVLVSVLPGLYR